MEVQPADLTPLSSSLRTTIGDVTCPSTSVAEDLHPAPGAKEEDSSSLEEPFHTLALPATLEYPLEIANETREPLTSQTDKAPPVSSTSAADVPSNIILTSIVEEPGVATDLETPEPQPENSVPTENAGAQLSPHPAPLALPPSTPESSASQSEIRNPSNPVKSIFRTTSFTSPPRSGSQDLYRVLQTVIEENIELKVKNIRPLPPDDMYKSYAILTENQRELIVRLSPSSHPAAVLESEVATMKYISTNTSIPVPEVLYWGSNSSHPLGGHIVFEKPAGVNLQTIYDDLASNTKEKIIVQLATWAAELFAHRFEKIGSLFLHEGNEVRVGPIVSEPFYASNRSQLDLDRGPWTSVREYFIACAQREVDCNRLTFIQTASESYLNTVGETTRTVHRCAALLIRKLIPFCQGLDNDDPQFAPFTLHLHELQGKCFYVEKDEENPHLTAIIGWSNMVTLPLWRCKVPTWIAPILGGKEDEKKRLVSLYKNTIGKLDVIMRLGLDLNETRQTLEEECRQDTTTDGALVLSSLETISTFLPGAEDFERIQKTLDPTTLEGRVARITTFTKGNAMESLSLAERNASFFKRPERKPSFSAGRALFVPKGRPEDDDY